MLKIHEVLGKRHSQYALDRNVSLSKEEITEVIEDSLLVTPSAFNAQTQRMVVLYGHDSDVFWDITEKELRKVAPAEGFESTVEKMKSFKAGVGTILFYIDSAKVTELQTGFPLYADNFPVWAQQENGMLQLVVWTSLSEVGLGGSLQHYNPLVDAETAKRFDIPTTWTLVAQMPFGNVVTPAKGKPQIDVKERIIVK